VASLSHSNQFVPSNLHYCGTYGTPGTPYFIEHFTMWHKWDNLCGLNGTQSGFLKSCRQFLPPLHSLLSTPILNIL